MKGFHNLLGLCGFYLQNGGREGCYFPWVLQVLYKLQKIWDYLLAKRYCYIKLFFYRPNIAVSLGKQIIPDLLMLIKDLEDPGKIADLTASILEINANKGGCGKQKHLVDSGRAKKRGHKEEPKDLRPAFGYF